jgi:hypothetical protein
MGPHSRKTNSHQKIDRECLRERMPPSIITASKEDILRMEIRGYIHIRTKIKVHQIKNKNKYQFLIVRHNIFLMEMMHRGHIKLKKLFFVDI